MMSPDEALNHLKELREDLKNSWVDIYADNADEEIIIKALGVAIAALEEKYHEQ